MSAEQRNRAWFVVLEAEGAGLDAFFDALEKGMRREPSLTWDEIKAAISDRLPFGIELDDAIDEYEEEMSA